MAKILIALRGVANVGKSTTIEKVYELLKLKYRNAQMSAGIFRRDIRVIIKTDRKKIGIESQGDPNSRLEASLELFMKAECKVIICATRTRGKTVDIVTNWRHKYKLMWFNKEWSRSKRDAENDLMARKIFQVVVKAIKE